MCSLGTSSNSRNSKADGMPEEFYLLSAALVRSLVLVVDATEIGNDDGDGQSDHQHAAQGADGAEDLPGNRLGHHVSVSAMETDHNKLDKKLLS